MEPDTFLITYAGVGYTVAHDVTEEQLLASIGSKGSEETLFQLAQKMIISPKQDHYPTLVLFEIVNKARFLQELLKFNATGDPDKKKASDPSA